jgi:hypothetical protein
MRPPPGPGQVAPPVGGGPASMPAVVDPATLLPDTLQVCVVCVCVCVCGVCVRLYESAFVWVFLSGLCFCCYSYLDTHLNTHTHTHTKSATRPLTSSAPCIQMLPLYCLGLQKSPLYRGAGAAGEPRVSADERAALVYRMLTMPVAACRAFAYPSLYSLHDLGAHSPRPPLEGLSGGVGLPPTVPLSIEHLAAPGAAFLLDNGVEMTLWFSRSVSPDLLAALLGIRSLDGVDPAALVPLRHQGNDFSERVLAIIAQLQAAAPQVQRLRIVRQGSGDVHEARFNWHLVHERQSFAGGNVSYGEYLALVTRESLAPPAAPLPAKA